MSASKEPLTGDELEAAVAQLTSWTIEAGKLHREFKFRDFIDAFGFMSKVAILAESMNHHPEWSNVYNTVTVDLSTHEVGGISGLDTELAMRIDGVA